MNEPAPYTGVLLAEPDFRYLKEQEKKCIYLESHPPDCVSKSSLQDGFDWVVTGLIVGFVTGLVLR